MIARYTAKPHPDPEDEQGWRYELHEVLWEQPVNAYQHFELKREHEIYQRRNMFHDLKRWLRALQHEVTDDDFLIGARIGRRRWRFRLGAGGGSSAEAALRRRCIRLRDGRAR